MNRPTFFRRTFFKVLSSGLIFFFAAGLSAAWQPAALAAGPKAKRATAVDNDPIGDKTPALPGKAYEKRLEISVGTDENQVAIIRDTTGFVPFGMFYGPSSFFVGPKSTLYVVDCRNHRVLAYDIAAGFKYLRSMSYFTDNDHIAMMTDIFVDDSGAIYLSDHTNHSVVKFSPAFEPVAFFGKPEPPAFAGIPQADEIACDKKGALCVRDHSRKTIYRFSPDGRFAGEMKSGAGFAFAPDNSHPILEFHEDTNSWKIFSENEKGETKAFLYEIKRESKEQNIQFVGGDAAGNFFVKSFRFGKASVYKISSGGGLLATYQAPADSGFDATRVIFCDLATGALYAARYNGSALEIDELVVTSKE